MACVVERLRADVPTALASTGMREDDQAARLVLLLEPDPICPLPGDEYPTMSEGTA